MFLFKNNNFSALSGFNLLRFSVIWFPASLNNCSAGTDVADIRKYYGSLKVLRIFESITDIRKYYRYSKVLLLQIFESITITDIRKLSFRFLIFE